MIADAQTVEAGHFADRLYDVCIVGSGPAGITLARRLAAAGLSVGLFEGGGDGYDDRSQECYQGETHGFPYYPLDSCRLRYFGGSSNHWGGWTKALDEHDFEPRAHHRLSGWPIVKADLDPYAAEADAILDLPRPIAAPDLLPPQDELVPGLFRFSRPVTRFGEKFRNELLQSPRVEAYTNANLVNLILDAGGQRVAAAEFRTFEGRDPFTVRARFFALCLGGIENARALLNFTSQRPAGIGNEHDLVGRYFMEHPHAPVGKAVLRDAPSWMLAYAPSREMMEAAGILNFGLRIGYFDQWNAIEFTGAFTPAQPCAASFEATLQAALRGEPLPCPALLTDVFVSCEQELSPDNRVRLTSERDRFGWRRAALDWNLSEMDRRTLREAAVRTAEALASHDRGRVQLVPWVADGAEPGPDHVWGGNHHMGTTRMSADARSGVVDADCRIHSVENLHLGGSSVFPTGGHANPTYTIVQLALRLGDHLSARLRG